MDPDINTRVERLYAAVGMAVDLDVLKYQPIYYCNEKVRGVVQEFSGGATEAEMSNSLHSLIHNIASFHDHLREWGPKHKINRENVHNYFKASTDFCIIRDLWNNDKHGYPPKDGSGWSRKAPRLRDVHRALQLGGAESWMQLTPSGPVYGGNGTREVVIMGTVIDRVGNAIGLVDAFVRGAVARCEEVLKYFGVAS